MDAFYASVTSFCFVLLGLWWNVVQARRDEWMAHPQTRTTAKGVYLSFLIPGLMALAAQLAGDAKILWRLVFVLAAALGALSSYRFIQVTSSSVSSEQRGWVRRHHWLVVVLYALVAACGAIPGLAGLFGLKPLQVEGLLLSVLIFLGASLAWEFMTEPQDLGSSTSGDQTQTSPTFNPLRKSWPSTPNKH